MKAENKSGCRICGSTEINDLWVLEFFGIMCTLHALSSLSHWTDRKVEKAIKTILMRKEEAYMVRNKKL